MQGNATIVSEGDGSKQECNLAYLLRVGCCERCVHELPANARGFAFTNEACGMFLTRRVSYLDGHAYCEGFSEEELM